MSLRIIGILCFDGVVALDIAGPSEAFSSSSIDQEELSQYKILLIGLNKNIVTSESGLKLKPNVTIYDHPHIDTLIIPGGEGLRKKSVNKEFTTWIKSESAKIRRIASVCTGIYGLLETGLLNEKKVTTHWRFADEIANKYPQIKMNSNAIYIKSGSIYTSAGATSGIDLALALIEEDNGPKAALSTARELVVYSKRHGGQSQYSEPLRFQVNSSSEFASLIAWIHNNYHLGLSVGDMAKRISLCPRQFSRRFKVETGSSPASFLQEVRLNEACGRLTSSLETIDLISKSVGFKNSDAFRRAFIQKFGVSPSHYCKRFRSTQKNKIENQHRHGTIND